MLQKLLDALAARLGYVRSTTLFNQLQFARSVGKRLDEHREVVEAMEESGFFEGKWWHVSHMATQDDYLMRLYHLVYGSWPENFPDTCRQITGEYVRPRPALLGPCRLPEGSGMSVLANQIAVEKAVSGGAAKIGDIGDSAKAVPYYRQFDKR